MRRMMMLAVALLLAVPTTFAAEEGEAVNRDALRKQLKEIGGRISKLRREVIRSNPELQEMGQKIEQMMKELNEKIAEASPELAELQQKRKELWGKLRPPRQTKSREQRRKEELRRKKKDGGED